MTSSFANLQKILIAQQKLVAELGEFHVELSSPDFDPMPFVVYGFTGYETDEVITKYVTDGLPQNRAEFQIYMIGTSIELLRTAAQLIDAQKSYESRFYGPSQKNPSAIEEDQKGFEELLKGTFDLNSKHKDENLPLTLDQHDFFDTIRKITDAYMPAAQGKTSAEANGQNAEELLKRIYELRIQFAELSLKRTDAVIKNISVDMETVLLLKKCMDEGILKPTAFLNGMIEKSMQEKETQIASVLLGHTAIHSFLSKTHEMDRGNDGLQDFEPDTYTSAPILGIAKFTP